MNISALLVFVSAVVSVYGYHGLPCSDCNQPCSEDRLKNVTDQLLKHMNFLDCRQNNHISNTANPTWKCMPSPRAFFDRSSMTVHNATCKKCPDPGFEAVPIVQNINVLSKKRCMGTNYTMLYVKPVTISLGCTCAKKN